MAGLDETTPIPTEITLHSQSKRLELAFDDGSRYTLPFEFLRVYSPSAEVRGHGPGQETLQQGKRDVDIVNISQSATMRSSRCSPTATTAGCTRGTTCTRSPATRKSCGRPTSRRSSAAAARATPPRHPRRPRAAHPAAAINTEHIMSDKTTHFGFETVAEEVKEKKVAEVFSSVAQKYDVMNDLMSFGLHRVWKHFTIQISGVREGDRVLDVAGGTADLSLAFARKVGRTGQVWLTDINHAMLARGRDRMIDHGFAMPVAQCNAEKLPFPDDWFDCVTVAFGLRNMTHKDVALAEMRRVLRPGGRLLVLEFSRVWKPLSPLYDLYSFKLLPWMGAKVANDPDSYRYLAESIRMHPGQEELKSLMEQVGLGRVDYFNLTAGVVALHRGYKI